MTNTARRSVWLTISMFSLIPVPARLIPDADRRTGGAALRWLPLLGAGLGAGAALTGAIFWHPGSAHAAGSPLLGAVVSITVLVVLNRGLHLDGLADVADALGSRQPAERALAIMKQSDIGPFGVGAAVLALLLQVAALAQVFQVVSVGEAVVLLAAVGANSRLQALLAAGAQIPSARPGGFGALVAGTASVRAQLGLGAAVAVASVVLARWAGLSGLDAGYLLGALAGGSLAAEGLRRHSVRRFGGVTGDVFGALIETALTASLLVLAAFASWGGPWITR